jgi:cobalt-zinc-cadmium efflux system protein
MAAHDHAGHSHEGHSHEGHSHAGHSHGGHGHGGHAHGATDARRLAWALGITLTFMLVEAVGGWVAGSLALVADAGHMLTDAGALALSWLALKASQRPADDNRTYGHGRAQVVAALVNGLALVAIVVWIVVEAGFRLATPEPIDGWLMMGVALVGGASNLVALRILQGGDRDNLNMQGAWLHVMSDLAGSVAAVAAAAVILATGWLPIDPILSILLSVLVCRGAWSLLRQSYHVLMEGTPAGLDMPALRRTVVDEVAGVVEVHHVHAWSLAPGRVLLTLHAVVATGADRDAVLGEIQGLLRQRFAVAHATVQIEAAACEPTAHGADCRVA